MVNTTALDANVVDDILIETEEDDQPFHSQIESEICNDIEQLLARRLVQLESSKMEVQEQLEWNSELEKRMGSVRDVQMKTHRVLNMLMQQIQSQVRSADFSCRVCDNRSFPFFFCSLPKLKPFASNCILKTSKLPSLRTI